VKIKCAREWMGWMRLLRFLLWCDRLGKRNPIKTRDLRHYSSIWPSKWVRILTRVPLYQTLIPHNLMNFCIRHVPPSNTYQYWLLINANDNVYMPRFYMATATNPTIGNGLVPRYHVGRRWCLRTSNILLKDLTRDSMPLVNPLSVLVSVTFM